MHLFDVISGMTSLLSAVVWIRARCHGWSHCMTNAVDCVNSTAYGIRLFCPSSGHFRSPEANFYFRCPHLRYLPCRCKCNGTTVHDDVIDTCRMTSAMSSQVTGDDYLSQRRATITRILLGSVRPTLWPNRSRREAGKSNLSDYFKDYSSVYPILNSTDYSTDYPTLNFTDYSNDHATRNSTDNSTDYYSDYSTDYSTNAMSEATQLRTNHTLSNRYGVIEYLTKSIDIKNHDLDGKKVVTTGIDAFTQNGVTAHSDAFTSSDATTQNSVITHNNELLGSSETNFQTPTDAKDQTSHSVTLVENDTVTRNMSVKSHGMTANALTNRDMTPSDHVTTTYDNGVTSTIYVASPNGTGTKHDVMSNVTVDAATDLRMSSDDVTVSSQLISDATKKSVLAPMRMNPLVNSSVLVNDTMVTDSMVTNSMVTDSVLANATVSRIDTETLLVTENYTMAPDATGLDATTSDTIATISMVTSIGNGDGEDELVIYYDDCPISGATMAFLAMVLVLIAMVIVLNCYGPRWGHVYRWRYSCRQMPAGPRITAADDNPCPMAHLAKVSDLPVRVEQRAY